MIGLENLLLLGSVFISSFLLLFAFYHSKFFSHLDVPNHRSMHEYPTKKSAGLVFVSIFIISLLYITIQRESNLETFKLAIITVPGLLICLLIGFLDDRYNFSSRRKLFFEVLFFIPYSYIFFPDFQFLGFAPDLPRIFYSIVLAGYFIFVINLCNFMDGLDLYLLLSVFSAIIIFFLTAGIISQTNITLLVILVTCLMPFIFFNFPPARLFMGDTGSLPLGYIIALLPFLHTSNTYDLGYSFLLIPVFWVDGVITILRRGLKKENIFQAHREHLYQRITLHFLDKRLTTLFFSSWNLISVPIFLLLRDRTNLLVVSLIILSINSSIYFLLTRKLSKN